MELRLRVPYGEQVTEAFFPSGEMSFHRAHGPLEERRDLAVRESLMVAEVQGELFVGRELAQCGGEIVLKIGLESG